MARKGQLYELFAKLVAAIPLPKGLPEGDGRKAVETWKVDQAKPFVGSAAKEYERCLGVSDKLLRFWEWSLVCESGLGHTDRATLTAWRKTHPYRGIRAPSLATKP